MIPLWLKSSVPLWLLLLALSVGLGGSAYYGYRYTAEVRAQRDQALQSLSEADTLRRSIQRQVTAAVAAKAVAEQKLKEALDESPEFRDAPVPVPVRDSVCATLRCK